ncbi:hypothetical protein PR048_003615, partial [Dryococelus australis]
VFFTGEVDVVWKFGSPEVHSKWVTTSDSDHNEGFSKCELSVSPTGNALFSGSLNTQVPRDGRIKKAGYCNMRSMRARKSFKRDSFLDWSVYTHLVLRVRGDGRSYMINLATCGAFDILWNDMFNYILFTRGGPYWQVAKVITTLNSEVLRAGKGDEVSMEQRWNKRVGETGDPQENPPTSGIVWHNSHVGNVVVMIGWIPGGKDTKVDEDGVGRTLWWLRRPKASGAGGCRRGGDPLVAGTISGAIPFSKFFLASKGRIQDKQSPIPLSKVTNVGISVGDKVNGPFNLEIDYIGVEFDPSHTEEFAYEMYRTPRYIAGT